MALEHDDQKPYEFLWLWCCLLYGPSTVNNNTKTFKNIKNEYKTHKNHIGFTRAERETKTKTVTV